MIDEEKISLTHDYVLKTPSGAIYVPECGIMGEADVVAYWRKLDERKLMVRK